jgi:hypothetical protein
MDSSHETPNVRTVRCSILKRRDLKNRAENSPLAAGRTAPRRMKRHCRELEIATFAPSRVHDESVSPAASASLDVMKILLEDLHRDADVVAEIIELPFSTLQETNDLLTTRLRWRHGFLLDVFNVRTLNVLTFKRPLPEST